MADTSRKGRKIARRACDLCRERRTQCAFDSETIASCQRCLAADVTCTFLTSRRPRGPPSRKAVEPRPEALSQPTGQNGASSPPIRPSALPSVTLTIHHLVPEYSFRIILEDFYTRVYPVLPLIHVPTFKRRLASRELDTNCCFLRLCMCLCAVTAAAIPRRFDSYGVQWYADNSQLVDRASQLLLFSRLSTSPQWQNKATLESIIESIIMSMACFYVGRPIAGWAYASEAMHFYRDLGLYRKEAFARYSLIDQEMCKRSFWLLFIMQAHDRLSHVVPHTGLSYHPINAEWQSLVPLELTDEELASASPVVSSIHRPLPTITGFTALIKVFICIVDVIDEAFPGSPSSYKMFARTLAPSLLPELPRTLIHAHTELPLLDTLFHLMSQMSHILNNLPDELKLKDSSSPSVQVSLGHFEIMSVNIHITSLYVQSVILETCVNKIRAMARKEGIVSGSWLGYSLPSSSVGSPSISSSHAVLWELRETLAKELLRIVSRSSVWVLESNGSSMTTKIREIAATLLEGEDEYDSARASDAEKRSRQYVAQFVDILADLDYVPKHQINTLNAT